MSHYHEGNVEEMEDDYDMDEPLEEDMDEVDNHGPVDRGSDSDDDEDYEHRQANDKISDTSAEEARSGKDIQGIPWDKLAVTREKYRQTRLEQYKNYENIPNSGEAAMKVSKSTEKGGTYYEFRRNTRSVKSTILHFQLRNLVWATSKHDVYLMSHYPVLHWSALSGVNTEIMNVQGHVAPSEDTANVNTKPTRRYPLASWIAILALITLVGVYIFSLSLKQNGMPFGLKQTNMIENEREKPCHDPSIPETEIPYVHYPTPDTYSRKECACTPVRFFAILSMQRSGSGWFETLLNSHENISSNGEIFSVKERRSNITSITKTLDKLYNLDWFSSAAKNECTAAVGLKWMLNQGLMKHHEEIVDYFNRRGVSAIFLLRKNLLQRYVSILANDHDRNTKQRNGTHKAHVHHRGEADVLAQYKPTIVTKSLIVELKRSDKLAADALVNFKKTRNIVLYYEDVVSNHTKLVDVLDFLKLPKTKLSSRHVKIHTKRLRDHIDNWIDVYNTLKGTQYESFLNDQR